MMIQTKAKNTWNHFIAAVSLLMLLSLVIAPAGSTFAQGVTPGKDVNLNSPSSVTAGPGVQSITGVFYMVYGDATPGSKTSAVMQYFIAEDNGIITELLIADGITDSAEGLLLLNNTRVVVEGTLRKGTGENATPILEVSKIAAVDRPAIEGGKLALTGTHSFLSIMCKFKDIADEPKNRGYFKGMYASIYPGLDHYWRELSYNKVNIENSTAVGWFTLDRPKSYYVYDNDNDGEVELDWGRAAKDCTAKADPTVNFANFRNGGINLMFNADLDCCAWGGGWWLTLDGINQIWPITWEPVWGYSNSTVIAHEMGHAFGLPHSSGHGIEYNNAWDVMADTWSGCSNSSDPIYGCLGQHTIAYYKDMKGWIPAAQKFTLLPNKEAYLKLEPLEFPSSGNYKMLTIPIYGSTTKFYTVELRNRVGYDVKLPARAVIIHKVDTKLGTPADVVDPGNNTYTWDEGAQWVRGEIFKHNYNRVAIAVLSNYATGTWVYVASGTVPIPGAPVLNSPVNGSFLNDSTPALSWKSVPYGFNSQVQLSKSSTFETIEQEKTINPRTLKWTPSQLEDGKYYWRVRNINVNKGNGAWSQVRRFIVDTKAPTAPILLLPEDGETVTGTPEYSWQKVPYSKYYQFVYAKSIDFSDVVYTSAIISTLSIVPPTQETGEYYWHVRAQDAAGNWGDWSLPRKVTIE